MGLRDIALTVREAPGGRFIWRLMEGSGDIGPFPTYVRLADAEDSFDSYSSSLVAGMAALRRLGSPVQGPQQRIDPP